MERLTRWNGTKYVLPQGYGQWRIIADRLAAYENTGLSPDEIETLKRPERRIAVKTNTVTYHFINLEEYCRWLTDVLNGNVKPAWVTGLEIAEDGSITVTGEI
jgi:hypothetical protein